MPLNQKPFGQFSKNQKIVFYAFVAVYAFGGFYLLDKEGGLLILLVSAFCGIVSLKIAEKRGLEPKEVFGLVGAFLGVVGLAAAFLMKPSPEAQKKAAAKQMESKGLKKCPECAESIKKEATRCKHCGAHI
ncbi:MAG: zinc ribbon domain-containing protein [Gammaproteobacteria bacterium]|nr:zinc ribbon domain-containing protein [Gammaproteobacteria bacterium]